jgi:demethylmenaquinone methyltransferase / 2-methoxy-6-polyprenyl-1,4-benzoquinol methylase
VKTGRFTRGMMKTDIDLYAHQLHLADVIREPVIRRAVRDLRLNSGDNVLDAGCGIGSNLRLLAERVGPSGHVTGLDISPGMISRARRNVAGCGLLDSISLVEGDVNSLPFKESEFDCLFSVDCVGYPYSANPVTLLRELKRFVRPGGIIALLGWSYQQLLPGYPLLESRLNTASSLLVPCHAEINPENRFLRASGWFQQAGFVETSSKSYAGDICAPLSDEEKEAIRAFFEMLWVNAREVVSEDEWQLYQLICKPGSREFLLDSADYYGSFVYTCFAGQVAVGRQ